MIFKNTFSVYTQISVLVILVIYKHVEVEGNAEKFQLRDEKTICKSEIISKKTFYF